MLPADAKRHSACDECRSRKLRCSGESTGCSRCRRDKMPCHYSLQKTMGRPRKHQNLQAGMAAPIEYVPESSTKQTFAAPQPEVQWQDPLLYSYQDPGPSGYSLDPSLTLGSNAPSPYGFQFESPLENASAYGINLDMGDPPDTFVKAWAETVDLSRLMTSRGLLSPSQNCECFPRLFSMISQLETALSQGLHYPQSLDALQRSFKLAQENFFCKRCQLSATFQFQSTMLLGTLVPLIIEGYRCCLESIDQEVAYLDSKGLQKIVGSYGAPNAYEMTPTLQHPSSQVVLATSIYRERSRQTLRQDIIGNGTSQDTNSILGLVRAYEQRSNERERRAVLGLEPSCPLKSQKWNRKPLCLIFVERSIEMIQGLGLGWSVEDERGETGGLNDLLLPSEQIATTMGYTTVPIGVQSNPYS